MIESAEVLERGQDLKHSPSFMVPLLEQIPMAPFGGGSEVGDFIIRTHSEPRPRILVIR